jgi:hypothetical protein
MRIPDCGYCDQPYMVVTPDGHWLCVLTTGPGREGQDGQHVVSTISTDRGKTWSPLLDIEPSDGSAVASWAVPLLTPSGRVYVFYDYNGNRIDHLPGSTKKIRADTLGWYCYKHSDDFGRSWSKKRYRLPLRVTACDRANNWAGKVQVFWGIDKPKVAGNSVLFAFTKLGRYMLQDGEGWLFHSDNILSEPKVENIHWETLPDGEHGIRAPEFGSVQEEHNLVVLDENRLYLIYRTTIGYPCHCYSDDRGHTWTKPVSMTYKPGGKKIKTPRACPKLWKCANGKYLFWFHNHGGKSYESRNPAWICGGQVRDGKMAWSQPEILLYGVDPKVRLSYPDLIEQDGRYWVTETEKTIARVHEIDAALLEGLWQQGQCQTVAREGLIAQANLQQQNGLSEIRLPARLDLTKTGGLSLDFWIRFAELTAGQVILDSRDTAGQGFFVTTTDTGAIQITLSDGTRQTSWDCDSGMLQTGKWHHVAAIVDAGPRLISFLVDGIFCDGGEQRQYGWGRYQNNLTDVAGSRALWLASSLKGELKQFRIYARPLRTSEAIANYRAGMMELASKH